MRLLLLSSLLCLLLLCFATFSAEGKKLPGKPGKGRCCPKAPIARLPLAKGRHGRSCRPCKSGRVHPQWVVPGALPQM
ncbi:protein GPR15LG [Dasypus novemcinctus]|uniref:protein GPR15LG n=1 Tax=Dasypus novemcinctus TaxID=9361 RepID=UPI0003288CCB|nr:protein GPR15LG [Dasypus novemcinctus]